jgi:methionyl-tRNA formyltransferase
MSPGLDTGDIVGQRATALDARSTLRETYALLRDEIVALFADLWPAVVAGDAPRLAQPSGGSYHRSSDKERHLAAMPQGWDTPCEVVVEYGRSAGLWLT